MDASEQLDDLLVYTIPNHHPPKMDVLPNFFFLQIILYLLNGQCGIQVRPPNSSDDLCLLLRKNPSSMPAMLFPLRHYIVRNTKWNPSKPVLATNHILYSVHCTVYLIITPPVQFVVIFVCFSSFPVLPLGAMDSKSLGAETNRTRGKVYSNIQNISLYLYISNKTN